MSDYQTEALRDISQDTRKHMPDEDFAGKGRSFPIEKPEDVSAAVHSIGRAGNDNYDSATLKRNIKRIAKRKGFALPDAWKDDDGKVDACDSDAVSMSISPRGPRFAVRLDGLAGNAKRIPIAILGKFQKGAQKFAITRQTLADIVRNFRKRPADTVIDYEHASEFPEAAAGQPIPASGWLQHLDDAPDQDGVLWGTAEFTPRAADLIRNQEYRYLSPVIDYDARDKRTGEPQGATLLSVALTNRPFLEAMPAIAMSDWRKGSYRGDAVDEGRKRVTKLIMADRVAGTVRVVADDGTENVLAVEGLEKPVKPVRLSDVKRGADGRYDFASLPQDEGVLIASDVIRAMQVDRELEAAVQAGKVTPAQRPQFEKMALSDLAGFRELVKTLPVQVDLAARGTGVDGAPSDEFARAKQALDTAITKKQAENKGMPYSQAWKLVASENRGLVDAYNSAARKREGK